MMFKRPESVLIVVHTRGGEVLLLRRNDRSGFVAGVHLYPGGAVDESCKRASVHGHGHRMIPGRWSANIEHDGCGLAPELRRKHRHRLGVDVTEDERPAVRVEAPGNRGSDPAPRTGDNRDSHGSRLAPMAPPRSPSCARR